MVKFTIQRNKDICIGCNECIIVCSQSDADNPNSVIVHAAKKGDPPEVKNVDNCIQCFNCMDHCRCSAISFENAHVVEILVYKEGLANELKKII